MMRKKSKSSRLRTLGRVTLSGLRILIVLVLIFFISLEVVVSSSSYPSDLFGHQGFDSTRIYDADGKLLREVATKDGLRARWTTLDEISPWIQQATIAVEDKRFHAHQGVDWTGVVRAAMSNAQHGRIVSGASTLTMQLARLIRPHERSFIGKMVETVDALRIERSLSKEEILEQYLNRAPYGGGSIGVEAASQRYFGKTTKMLSLAEAALLAGIPNSPSNLNPLKNPERAKKRQMRVLEDMFKRGFIDEKSLAQAQSQKLAYRQKGPVPAAMHFTEWVLRNAPNGDVVTSLDGELQHEISNHVRDHLKQLKDRGVTHASVVVLDNATCAVRAMIGSADYWAREGGAVNGALALRQPGSTLKPFTYALAFEQGASPSSIVADTPVHYAGARGGLYSPRNYEDRFSGPVMMGDALGKSLNVPAIRVARMVGIPNLLRTLRTAGLTSLRRSSNHYGLGLTLGNGEVTLLELTQAYAMFPRGGVSCEAHHTAAHQGASQRVFSPSVVELTDRILKNERLRIEAFGPNNALLMDRPVAVKTGTSSDWRDNWAIGYTDTYTIGIWLGDTYGRPMQSLAGVSGAGPLFRRVLESLPPEPHTHKAPHREKSEVVTAPLCALSGKIPGPSCGHVRHASIRTQSLQKLTPCDWHKTVRVDTRNNLLAGPTCEEEHVREEVLTSLPAEYAQWQAARHHAPPPTSYSPHCPAADHVTSHPHVTFPRSDERFAIDPGHSLDHQRIRLTVRVPNPVDEVIWFVDGKEIGRARWPYAITWPLSPGSHTVQVGASGKRSPGVSFLVL